MPDKKLMSEFGWDKQSAEITNPLGSMLKEMPPQDEELTGTPAAQQSSSMEDWERRWEAERCFDKFQHGVAIRKRG